MRSLLVGEDALLVECDGPTEVRATYAALLARREAGELSAVDVVPAAGTVLLDGLRDRDAVRRLVADLRPEPEEHGDDEAGVVEIPVTYDGPDLDDVARAWDCTTDEVGQIHADLDHVVAFCGFAPGFAYCTGLPAELEVSRLDEPRTKVPAGSVGLAGGFTGIYPRESPGGWRLIGRTDLRLWDAEADPPALLGPGTRIRFVP